LPGSISGVGEVQVLESVGDGTVAILSVSRNSARNLDETVPADVADLQQRCQQIIERNPRITIDCEPNLVMQKHAEPNDAYYPSMYNLKQISAPTAWDISTGTKDVIVAILDSGLDYAHVEISDNLLINRGEIPLNRVDDDRNGFVDDYFGYDFAYKDSDPRDDDGHGTHVAGTIGAVSNNQLGVAGVAWNVSLLPVKVLTRAGWGTNANIAAGIQYAVMRGAKVINLSLGGDDFSPAIRRAIIAALRKDVLVVVSAGNDLRNIDLVPHYPASMKLDNIISVAATNASDTFAGGYSNFGPNSVDVAAPGTNVLSVWPNNYLSYETGTSMSAPHVSAIAAVMRGLNPTLSFAETKTIIMNTVDQRPTLAGRVATAGRVNFAKAVRAAQYNLRNPAPPSRIISVSLSRNGAIARLSGAVTNQRGFVLVGEWTTLICNGQGMSKVKSRVNGYYEYSFRPAPATTYSCYIEDDRGSRSKAVQFRI
jgi:subtilisin family serine protease